MDEDKISMKNISTKWLDSLFESIQRIKYHERLAREGCESLVDFVQNIIDFRKNLTNIQIKNLRLMLNEIKMILPEAKFFLDDQKDEYKKLKVATEKCCIDFKVGHIFRDKKKLFIFKRTSNYRNQSVINLGEGFNILLERTTDIKERLLDNLDNILLARTKPMNQQES